MITHYRHRLPDWRHVMTVLDPQERMLQFAKKHPEFAGQWRALHIDDGFWRVAIKLTEAAA